MRIALINENSQAAKNATIEAALKKAVAPMGHQVDNYGMYGKEGESQLTFVQNGILAAILLNSGAADYVVTGCGTGEGAMLALNSFPGVLCGHVVDPSDGFMFAQINDAPAAHQVCEVLDRGQVCERQDRHGSTHSPSALISSTRRSSASCCGMLRATTVRPL